jgi:1,2-diacylglycerol-3-alpha-glucose alpha-1,2-glucosyltransferase
MNIIFIVNFHIYKKFTKIKTIGGIETNTRDVIKELRLRGHNVWIPTGREKTNWVKEGDVDLITTSTFDPLTYLELNKYKNKFTSAACVIHAHTTVEDLKGNFLPDKPIFNLIFKYWLKILYREADLLITPSSYSKKCLEDIQTTQTYPIYAVSNGIRIAEFERKSYYRKNFRDTLHQKFGIPKDAKIIINVGLSWKKKGVDTFGKIAKHFPNYYFVWVGPVNKNPDIEIVSKLENVTFTGFYEDIREAYYGADLFLNTSRVENQGIPLIEAAICQLPIIAADLPAFNWIEDQNECIKTEDVEDYVRGINKIFSEASFREKIIENAYKKALKLHDFKKIGDKIEKLYKRAILIKKYKLKSRP